MCVCVCAQRAMDVRKLQESIRQKQVAISDITRETVSKRERGEGGNG